MIQISIITYPPSNEALNTKYEERKTKPLILYHYKTEIKLFKENTDVADIWPDLHPNIQHWFQVEKK